MPNGLLPIRSFSKTEAEMKQRQPTVFSGSIARSSFSQASPRIICTSWLLEAVLHSVRKTRLAVTVVTDE
jgi:hypothetical protein